METTPPHAVLAPESSATLPALRYLQEGLPSQLRLPSLFSPSSTNFISRSDGLHLAGVPENKPQIVDRTDAKMHTFLNWDETRAIHPTTDVPAPALHPVLQSCSAFSPKASLMMEGDRRDSPRNARSVIDTGATGATGATVRAPPPHILPYHVQALPQIPLGTFPMKKGSPPQESPPYPTSPHRAASVGESSSIESQNSPNASSGSKRKRPSRTRHNMAEQKRRQQMRDSFDRLKTLLPNMEKKMSKVTLLNETFDYISQLKQNGEKTAAEIQTLKAELAESERRRKKEKKKRKEMYKKERRRREESEDSAELRQPQKRPRVSEEQRPVASDTTSSPHPAGGSATATND